MIRKASHAGGIFGFISQFGYLAVAALILFENVFPPIPSELILPLSGFLAPQTEMTLPGVIIAATVGSVVGAYFLYGIGRLLYQERLEGFFDTKPMRMLGFHSDDVAKAIGWFDRKGQITVLICRCGVIIAATVGSVVGAYFLYGIGRLLSQERLEGFFDTKPMRMLGFHSDDVAKAIGWFDRKGQITVLICRCIPVVRSLISIPAGTAKMNMVRFALYTLVGSLAWNAILCTLGFWAGGAWEQITAQAEWVSDVVKVVIIVVAVGVVAWWVKFRILSDVVKVVIIVVAVGVVAWWVKFRILPARAEQKRRGAEGK